MKYPRPQPNKAKRERHKLHLMTLRQQALVIPQSEGASSLVLDESFTAADTAIFLANLVRMVRTLPAARYILRGGLDVTPVPNYTADPERRRAELLKGELSRSLKIDTDMFKVYFPEHSFHPSIMAACEAIRHVQDAHGKHGTLTNVKLLLQLILQLVDEPKYVEIRRRHRKARTKRVRETKDYINELFKAHSRIMAVRVDLSYSSGLAPAGNTTVRNSLTFRQVWRHRREFFSALPDVLSFVRRKKEDRDADQRSPQGHTSANKDRKERHDVFPLLGFVARLEWAPHKSYHLHVLVLLDGRKVEDRTAFAKKMGDLWCKVTGGLGNHWEPGPHLDEKRGTGCFHREDYAGRAGLIEAAMYLCKQDYYIGFHKGERDRTFFHGRLNKA